MNSTLKVPITTIVASLNPMNQRGRSPGAPMETPGIRRHSMSGHSGNHCSVRLQKFSAAYWFQFQRGGLSRNDDARPSLTRMSKRPNGLSEIPLRLYLAFASASTA